MPPEEQGVRRAYAGRTQGVWGCHGSGRLGLSLRAGLKGLARHGQGSGTSKRVMKGMGKDKLNGQED